jgi:ferredoxin-type protein NapH
LNALPNERGQFAAVPDRVIRLYTPPANLAGKLWSWRFLILRRACQVGVLLLFYGTVHWGWQVAGKPLLTGNLSASEFLGLIPMADGFAVLQQLMTGHMLQQEVLLGAVITIGFYTLIGGRIFCSWVCPVNVVTDLAGWLRNRLGIPDPVRFPRRVRYGLLVLSLAMSVIMGVAAFEWLSPISMLHREIIYGIGLGVVASVGIFFFDLFIKRHGWCGHVCPLGAFYALLGKAAQVRIRFDKNTCTHCGECHRVCPEPKVLDLKDATDNGMVVSGECTNCFRCVPICPEHSLGIDLRALIKQHNLNSSQQARRQA